MRFELSEDQQEIQRTARELLAERSSFAQVRAAAEARREDDALWGELRELGWPGIAIGEAHGGSGLGVIELAAIAEELGRAVTPVPFLGTALAGLVVQHDGDDEQRERWLPGLASGELRGAVTLPGDATPVPGAADEGLVVVATADGPLLHAPGSGVATAVDAIDPTRGHGRVAATAPAATDGGPGGGLDRAAVVVAAELVGVLQRALDLTVAYVKDRKQFGVPVGSFQAVKHEAAQMLRDVEVARVLVANAAWVADAGEPDALAPAAALAKAAASAAGRRVGAQAIQLHGGIGFTWEADLHWLFKRAHVDAVLLGGAGHHRRRIARHAAAAVA
ncbi:acyl-CoA dehydrogenase family protein [Patulibacter defluvii]|uniref:acyl-CoA dehydrogenase family protein n=1 Tax=Patulibacter defluvii TaxID=3095358 RepID=UPI002A75345D|nr:acyl-CoA dehydrogenase family protein [Patulibacter sp. DM4]